MKAGFRTIVAILAAATACAGLTALSAAEPGVLPVASQGMDGQCAESPSPYAGGQGNAAFAGPYGCGPAAGPGACCPGGGCGCGSCPSCRVPLAGSAEWRFGVDAVVLQRSSSGSQQLLGDPIGNNPVFNAKDFNFPMAGGFSVRGERRGMCGWDVEGVYAQVISFQAARHVAGPVWMDVDGAGNVLPSLGDVQAEYKSQLFTGELNLWRHFGERFRLLGGFRALELEEHFSAAGSFPALGFETVDEDAHNNLYGFQLGADVMLIEWMRLNVNCIAKAGAYSNTCSQNGHVAVQANPPGLFVAANGTHTAFLGEIGLQGTVEITSSLFFRGGYQLMWLDGVALAPDQLAVNNFVTGAAGLRYGTVFYHGANMGFELHF
jgi:hypothetical protein